MEDLELLREWVTNQSEAAFGSLVKRHINLVYSAARRQVQDAHLAEEISQAVFLVLARKAASLPPGTILPGWLVRTTRFTAANALRREQTRRHHESQAMTTTLQSSLPDPAWERIAPLLDEALVGLRGKDRDALVLRFFEGKSFREVAQALGASEDSAQKRVSRALEKLRRFFARHGHLVPAVALAGALASNSVQAAPGGLAASVTTAALLKGGATVSGAALCQATLQALARARFKLLAGRGAAIALIAVTALLLVEWRWRPGLPADARVAQTSTSASDPPTSTVSPTLSAASGSLPTGLRPFAFRVLDAGNSAPLAGVKLTLREVEEYPNRRVTEFVTDRNGFGLLPPASLDQKNWGYQIEVLHDGYVPKYVSWSASQGDVFAEFPAEHTTRLDRAVTIGGVVVNEAGDPISGARIVFSVSGPSPGASRDRERLTMMGNYHQEMTGNDGRWTCNHVPEAFGMITWNLVHLDYQEVTYGVVATEASSSIGPIRLPKADFLAGRAVMTMKHGLVVAGIVADEAGQPVVNAKVTLGRQFEKPEASVTTRADGKFRFGNARERETILTVQAAAFAPQDRKITPRVDLPEQRFVLNSGGVLRGRVLDEQGNPVLKAAVTATSDERGRRAFEWRGTTDSDGRFEWRNAPLGTNAYSVSAGGHDSSSGLALATDGSEHVITLKKNTRNRLRVIARVFDAETQQPIERFKMLAGESQEPLTAQTNSSAVFITGFSTPQPKAEGRAGVGVMTLSSYTTKFIAEIQAEGYLPARATNVNLGQGEITIDFKLAKAGPVRGVVRWLEGQPVEGAKVVLLAGHDALQMHAPKQFQADQVYAGERTQTDAHGRFSFAPKLEMRRVVAWHELGFGEISPGDLEASGEIILQPWGRVEGVFHSGQRPAANATVQLQNMYWRFADGAWMMLVLSCKTDSEGRFAFEGVPPGDRRISYCPEFSEAGIGAMAVSHDQVISVKPGETTRVSLGGSGRILVGRVDAEGVRGPVDWLQDTHTLTLKVPLPPEAVEPRREEFVSDREFLAAMQIYAERSRPFWLSEAGREAQRRQKTFVLLFNPDGTFRLNDVPPGTYELSVTPMEPPAPVKTAGGGTFFPAFGMKPIGSLKMEVVVPDGGDNAEAGRSVDLGALRLVPASP